jgi:hypothetical protein
VGQFLRLPAADRAALLEALAVCTAASIVLKVMPFSRVAPRLGRHMAETPAYQPGATSGHVPRVGWAVGAAARALPWKPLCFPQAITAKWMLKRRGIQSTLYLGTDPKSNYDAHAWVRAGGVIVTGGPHQGRFAIVSSFA